MIATATGVRPLVAGKPEPPLHHESVLRTGAERPLVVGDRLDTDIEGAHRVGSDSLLVLTGVTGPAEAILAPPSQRPTYLAEDLAGLLEPHPEVTSQDGTYRCGGWTARQDGNRLELAGPLGPVTAGTVSTACVRRARRPGRATASARSRRVPRPSAWTAPAETPAR